ncbi:MAG: STAS domain-containing protein, partial [Parabacteroides sp.]
MEITIQQEGNETRIKVSGRLDTITTRECEKQITPLWEQPAPHLVVDCSELSYVSSAGLRLFLVMQKQTTALKGSLRLVGMQPMIR